MTELPKKKYNVIYADPPWKFSSKELQDYGGQRFTPLEKHYGTEKTSWIESLDVKSLADKDCALFLWSTDAHLQDAMKVMKAWGFKYVTIAFIWEKVSKNGVTVSNLAPWTLKNYEICLLGTKGGMLKHKQANNIRQKVIAERRKHSQKPDEIRVAIEKLFGNVPKIELFARQKFAGWDSWGDGV